MDVDGYSLQQQLGALVPDLDAELALLQDRLLQFVQQQRQALEASILDPETCGFELGQAQTAIFDAFVQKVYQIAQVKTGITPDLAIFAVGSYGRRELCPFSDIDIAYTSGTELQEGSDDKILDFVRIFYEFMDTLERIRGIRISFVYRPFCDALKWNYQDMAALIDARFLAGDSLLLDTLRTMLREQRNEIPFILNLLNVRDELYSKQETLYLNQPNIKLGKGGLRNIQLALWMRAIERFVPLPTLYEELADPDLEQALGFMLKVRSVLHILTRKPTDHLTYDPDDGDHLQAQVAAMLGFDGAEWHCVYEFMRSYYSYARYLHLTAELLVTDLLDMGIRISHRLAVKQGRIYCSNGSPEDLEPSDFFLILRYFQQHDFEIDAEIARYLAGHNHPLLSDRSHEAFLSLFSLEGDISRTLIRMHRLGLLEYFVPGFEQSMMTRSSRANDPYTVGRHTLEAIYHLDQIKQTIPSLLAAPFSERLATEEEILHGIYQEVAEPELIYFALLFHDIDKPVASHELKGAEKARAFGKRMGFNSHQIHEICFLIEQHLTMIELARYHQVTEAKLQEFADRVESLDRLCMLYLLTYCDAKANGPENWTDVDRDNLKRLYEITRTQLAGDSPEEQMSMAEVGAFLQDMPVTYRINRTPGEIYQHVRMMYQVEESQDPAYVALHFVDKPGFTEIHFCGADRIGLLQGLTGIFYAYGLDLRDAVIYTTAHSHIALDICKLIQPSFNRQARTEPLDSQTRRDLAGTIRRWLRGDLTLEALFESKRVSIEQPLLIDRVEIETSTEAGHMEISVRAMDQIGFVHCLTRILTGLGLSIRTSKCSVLGGTLTNRYDVIYSGDPDLLRTQLMQHLQVRHSKPWLTS